MDVDIPWESRMNKAKEGGRWLASKLCKIDFIMRTAEVQELDRRRVEGRFKEVVINRRAIVGKMQQGMKCPSDWIGIFWSNFVR